MRLLISSSSQPSFPLINFPRYSALLELQPFKPFLVEKNAVDQWRLRLLFTATGHLGTLICIIIGHLRGTVKTFHKARLEWNYG